MASRLEYTFTKNGVRLSGMSAARMDVGLFGNPSQPGQAYNGDWEIMDAFTVYSPPGEEKKGMRFFSLGAPSYTPSRAFVEARGAYILALNGKILQGIQQIGELSKMQARLSQQQRDAIMGRNRADQRRSRNLDGTELQTNSNDGVPWVDGKGNVAFGDDPGAGNGGWTKLKQVGE